MGRNINPQNGAKMNMILFENPPTVYFERIEDYEEKSTPWRRVPPTYKGSSTKSGRNKKQIRRDRNRWFNKRVVLDMAKDYIEKLKKRFDELKLRKCKGIPYKRINGQNIFVDDFDKKVIKPLLFAVHKIQHSENTYELWHSVQEFNKRRIKMHWDTPQNAAWLDAYKGSGAFFTMQNMIRFHNCVIIDDNGKTLGKNASLAFLNKKAKLYENREGWRLIGMLKKMLDDNNIDVVAKMKEWRK